jgi:predicted nucleic acid-binding protein
MFASASALIARAQNGEVELELSPLVLAETAFTLESFFKQPRKEVAGVLSQFVTRLGIRLAEKDLLLDALERVRETGVHLVDAYLAALASKTKLPVASFDRDLDKFEDITRLEPKP